jgi:hypothetical protein
MNEKIALSTSPAFMQGKTGTININEVPDVPFSAGSTDYALEDPYHYGGAAEGGIVKIFYDPPEGRKAHPYDTSHSVAAFMSYFPQLYIEKIEGHGLVIRIAIDLKKNLTFLEDLFNQLHQELNDDSDDDV